MSAAAAASWLVVLNQQREQRIQHHEHCNKATIVPCKVASSDRTIVENGKVVVKPLSPQATQPSADTSPEA